MPDGSDIAVVGLACRLPKAADPAAFWRLLAGGVDGTTDPPADRRSGAGRGGFLDRIAEFDAEFFGISPNEAAAMDPQQRLMLELSWEAVEDAGVPPATLRGSRTGVYFGVALDDYAALRAATGTAIDHFTLTGQHRSIVANRVSYFLGMRGPSVVVDTGQSSSLVAVHLACESLRSGESSAALAGGVNLNLASSSTVSANEFGALSPDGRCYTFDERANGYVRGEGGGIVVLKRLADALADGDEIYCVIRGSAVNNDGGGAGLTVPDGDAQADVLRRAYERAGVDPAQVQYLELHGTGTKVGDPVEAASAGAVFGVGRGADRPLLVGSVKTNIGHLEGAAGIAGLLKVVLALQHRHLPGSLNFRRPNPNIGLTELKLRVLTELGPWPRRTERLLAGVSSWGMGGTNCHVVLGDRPDASVARPPAPTVIPWLISAPDERALGAQADRLRSYVNDDVDPADVGYALATGRTAFEHRAVVLGSTLDQLHGGLAALAEGRPASGVVRGHVRPPGRLAVLFPGQGAQWLGMGRELCAAFDVFAAAFNAAAAEVDRHLDRPLRSVLWGTDPALLDRTRYTQAGLFVVGTALYRLLESWGVRPDYLIGHSIGELVAAHVSGVWSLADAAEVVVARGRLMDGLPEGGAMASLVASADEVGALLGPGVELAAVNGPTAVVVSGDDDAVREVAETVAGWGRRVKFLAVSHAFHSFRMDPMLGEFGRVVAEVPAGVPRIPLISNVTGAVLSAEDAAAPEYWTRHARTAVRFADGIDGLVEQGVTRFIECGPGGVLSGLTQSIVGVGGSAVPVLRKDRAEAESVVIAAARLHVEGVPIRWETVFGGPRPRPAHLPTYAFQRRRHWLDIPSDSVESGSIDSDLVGSGRIGAERVESSASGEQLVAGVRGGPRSDPDPLELVRSHAAAVLGHDDPAAVGPTRVFKQLGFDSLTLVDLVTAVNAATGLAMPAGVVFDHPTPAALAAHIAAIRDTEQVAPDAADRTVESEEPVAIIAMSCRLPGGVRTPEQLWQLLTEGRDVIAPFPASRGWDVDGWYDPDPDRPGHSYVRTGGILDDADQFDAEFFGISPREATAMDPQQRLLLETAWEAFERSGIDPDTLRGSRTGVFIGAMPQSYAPRINKVPDGLAGYLLTGTTTSVASGRIAYTFGLNGPAITVDTACSASLAALHLACQSVRSGESSLALVGGATVMANPDIFVELSRQRALSPDGRCKAFGAAADGTGWSEGAVVLLVERLTDALRAGHEVLAVVRGSAANQDGASNGLTAPSGLAQQQVIRRALANARLSAAEIDAVEAHGTGTALGDPVEAGALLESYGRQRERPLLLGSLKSNIGHTQAAAGLAGVAKMVLAMRHGVLPRTLHVDEPSPHVDWSAGGLALLTESVPWPQTGAPRRAGVSAFGISGTNVHVIIEQAPPQPAPPPAPALDTAVPWVLSARDETALRARADQLLVLASDDMGAEELAKIGYSLALGRADFEHRAAVVGADLGELRRGLAALAGGGPDACLIRGRVVGAGKVVFVFPGQGSQWVGMARELLDRSPVFAAAVQECDAALRPFTGWSMLDVLRGAPDAPERDRVDVVQPTLFTMMVSLAAVWRSYGVTPSAVVGHSQGEIAAAYVAGALSLEDAARVVALRSQAWLELAGKGGVLAVPLPAEQVVPRLPESLSLAAVNAPDSVAVSGDPGELDAMLVELAAEGVKARRVIGIDTAGHSHQVEVLRERLLRDLAPVSPQSARIPFYSTVTGDLLDATTMDAEYWYRNMREPVLFEAATRALLTAGHDLFIETSPNSLLASALQDTAADAQSPLVTVASLRRDDGGPDRFVTALTEAWAGGATPDWTTVFGGSRERVELPTYPFQRSKYWLEAHADADVASVGLAAVEHPVLGAAVELADGGAVLTGVLSTRSQAWLSEYTDADGTHVPSALLVELAAHAGDRVGAEQLAELTIDAPLVLAAGASVTVQVAVAAPDESGTRTVTVHSAAGPDAPWTRHAHGTLVEQASAAAFELTAWPPADAVETDFDGHPGWRVGDDMFVELTLPEAPGSFGLHPLLLETVVRAGSIGKPKSWQGFTRYATGASVVRARIGRTRADSVSVWIADAAGAPVAVVESVVFGADAAGAAVPRDSLFRVEWPEMTARVAQPETGSVVPLADESIVVGPDGLGLRGVRFADLDALPEPCPEVVVADLGAESDVAEAVELVLGLAQSWVERPRFAHARLVIVTRNAVAVQGDEVPSLAGAAVWGFVRSVQAEHPDRVVLVDIAGAPDAVAGAPGVVDGVSGAILGYPGGIGGDSDATDGVSRVVAGDSGAVDGVSGAIAGVPVAVDSGIGAAAGVPGSVAGYPGVIVGVSGAFDDSGALAAAIASGEPQVAVRAGVVRVPRLARVAASSVAVAPVFPSDGTVLITGATGTLGVLLARHLVVAQGVQHILAVSRGGPAAPAAAGLVAELAEHGAEVTVVACDVADRDALRDLLSPIPPEHPLVAVIHAAGVLDDGVVAALTPDRVRVVLRAKADAARYLHELTAGCDLRAFVMYSSMVATLGGAGQAGYGAANAVLDALAQQRHAAGLPALSLGWGFWAERSGMSAHLSELDLQRMARSGVRPLASPEGMALFDAARAVGEPVLLPVGLDPAALRRRAEQGGAVPPLLRGLVRVSARRVAAGAVTSSFAERVAALPASERKQLLLELVRRHAAAVLGHPAADAVGEDQAFRDAGYDSLTAVELRNQLQTATGLRLPATLLFDHPTPAVLAAHLDDELRGEPTAATKPATVAVSADDPIVIVGMSCRFPGGVRTPEQLWHLLAEGRDVISAFPEDRNWDVGDLYDPDPDKRGKSYVRLGGFLYDAYDFDPAFFGIAPREALAMDPQQRLLLEISWELFERAGIAPNSLRGSSTGVFIGTNGQDYAAHLRHAPQDLEGYLLTGQAASVVSGRVAYTLGLEGPALTLDTACSSSLVAMHLAAHALRRGECSLAVAGGVTVMSTPSLFVEFSRQRGLAPDGRCKAFATAADGTAWGEGVGMVLLERLSDARRNGHEVLARIAGSAINQDGASNGLAAPNGPSQQRVIRQALAEAGLSAADVDAVEAHGTGTRLGDPIEAQAILATYGRDRERPLWLGALKSNIGHTQAAAGVAGVIKMVLAMRHGVLPKTLHVDEPSAHVDWSAGSVELLTEQADWPATGKPRRAGISAFGISGTNGHVILAEGDAPELTNHTPAESDWLVWPISARDPDALRELAAQLETTDGDPATIGTALATTRSIFDHRAVLAARDRDGLLTALRALAAGAASPGLTTGLARSTGQLAFVFSGQGAQLLGMGRELHAQFPVFAAALDAAITELDQHLDRSLKEVMWGDDSDLLEQTGYAQPALFAVQTAQAALLIDSGVRPDYVAGHSVGELAAAYIAGAMSLADAARLVAARGTLMQQLPNGGAMVAVAADPAEVRPLLTAKVDIAAINGPRAVVLSGDTAEIDTLAPHFAAAGHRTSRLRVSHAFHSAQMEPMLERFRAVAETVRYTEPAIPVVSGLTGEPATFEELGTAEYWVRHVREAVRFADSVGTLSAHGVTRFVEVGPTVAIAAAIRDCAGPDAVVESVAHKEVLESDAMITALARLYVGGVDVHWAALLPEPGGRVQLPTYPFQRQRYWFATAEGTESRERAAVDSWRYRIAWQPVQVASAVPESGWLVVVPAAHATEPFVRAVVGGLGEDVVQVDLDVADRESIVRILSTAISANGRPIRGVLSLLALDERMYPQHKSIPCGLVSTLALTQALAELPGPVPLWLVTRDAVVVADGDRARGGAQAAVAGLGRVIGLEQPGRWGGLIDLPAVLDRHTAGVLAAALSGTEDQVAIRQSGIFVRRIVRAVHRDSAGWAPRDTVLITGGTGGLGAQLARWAAANGASRIVLASRRGPQAQGAGELHDELTALGARVTIAACDTAQPDAVRELVERVRSDGPPIRAVLHAAGVVRFGTVADLTPADLAEAAAGKVSGVAELDRLFRDDALDAFVLFSSIAATWGSGEQGAYAAANACLDALAEQRRSAGYPAVSIAWGPWAGKGMIEGDEVEELLIRRGLVPMAPALAIDALRRAASSGGACQVIADVRWDRFAPAFTSSRPRPLIADLPEVRALDTTMARPAERGFTTELAELPAADRPAAVLALVRDQAAAVLGHASADALPAELAFNELGFDSMMAVELRDRLTRVTGLPLPTTVLFDHPSAETMSAHLLTALSGDGDSLGGELDRLELAVSRLGPDGTADRKQIVLRLRALLSRFENGSAPTVDEVGAATAEEIFDFIDNELGA